MKYIFLSIFAVFCYTLAMTFEPEQQGYSRSDVSGMNRLIDRETRFKSVSHYKAWSAAESRIALQELGWEVGGK